jgi:hypothetical protein
VLEWEDARYDAVKAALLGRKVDLLAADGIKENRRSFILSSLLHVVP